MECTIRQAKSEDAAGIAHLIKVLGYGLKADDVPARLEDYANDASRVFVAVHESGALVGFLSFHAIPLFHEPGALGRITAMAIDPEHERQGIGTALVGAAEEFARVCDCLRVEVTSGDRREKDAHVFYAKLGYASDCRRFLKRLEKTPS
ncbi:ribosomal protein S18 acetylase RimI-like enzyme [Roseimicrobium gellanilyticum]|uniref:Ribosomal protein S18 acetylase RimI-like enzyme n=1 Tax=Roseimicrobium gellanilyticum TaxID=748857 RepID=A0A366HTJ4_9BACT|nr:GNAT family N-acetyltransferase [Roseimicrobium gellanilyticum]RBP46408.1 ribosomal protein S18 acetylase RimI-like enzyme [Roseimicrobium gellanilyticum]